MPIKHTPESLQALPTSELDQLADGGDRAAQDVRDGRDRDRLVLASGIFAGALGSGTPPKIVRAVTGHELLTLVVQVDAPDGGTYEILIAMMSASHTPQGTD